MTTLEELGEAAEPVFPASTPSASGAGPSERPTAPWTGRRGPGRFRATPFLPRLPDAT